MTVPAGARRDWCASCEDTRADHSRICTVCGSELQYPRTQPPLSASSEPPSRVNLLPVPSELLGEDTLQQAGRELRQRLGGIRERIRETDQEQRALLQEIFELQRLWQDEIPPGLLDPNSQQPSGRPTAKECLDGLPRIVLQDRSSLFRRASVAVKCPPSGSNSNGGSSRTSGATRTMTAIPGEFGPIATTQQTSATASTGNGAGRNNSSNGRNIPATKILSNARLIVAEPLTGKGGRLSDSTVRAVRRARAAEAASMASETDDVAIASAVLLYMERGDDVTFVRKAILAQEAGAAAVVIGNNRSDPWPYTMRDSQNEAATAGLRIPAVMVKQSDGREIVTGYKSLVPDGDGDGRFLECTLTIEANDANECVVCTDAFEIGNTVMTLPNCGHVFHEQCALAWLRSHNTCPYCRRELPTDDEEYERTRRREQRTHAGSEAVNSSTNHEFYG